MTLIVSNIGEKNNLELFLGEVLTLKLFSNDIIPGETDTAGSYTEVVGGGYAAKTLQVVGWTITENAPSYGTYVAQSFSFTGVTDAPGTVYGYYVVNAANVLKWVERFAAGVLPFSPINTSTIRVTPRFEAS